MVDIKDLEALLARWDRIIDMEESREDRDIFSRTLSATYRQAHIDLKTLIREK